MHKQKKHDHTHRKRHGLHQKQTKPFLKTYYPYLPLILIVLTGLGIGIVRPAATRRGVLAYATNVSAPGLLDSTNQQRATNGQAALGLNGQLNSAAQTKANDMATRGYWSHNTPEGQEPWIFFEQAGYSYQKAGENLAYGFTTSNDTVTGWMNSPAHKANMLDSAFLEVGFGYANNENYQSSGQQTIVVAMYGKPQVASAVTQAPAPTPAAAATPAPTVARATPPAATTPAAVPAEQETPTAPANETLPVTEAQPVNSDQSPLVEPAQQKVARIQTLTAGNASWSLMASLSLMGSTVGLLALRHGLRLRRWLLNGERFIMHHALFDITLVAFIALLGIISRTDGIIR